MDSKNPTSYLFNALKIDLKRYREYLYPDKKKNVFLNFLVLLKSPGLWPIIHHRFGFWINTRLYAKKHLLFKTILKLFYFIGRYLCVCLFKVEISIASDIKPGLFISNRGNIMLGAYKMGANCTLHHNVTLGQGRDRKEPVLGDNVWVGHDSILYGGISIGNNCMITDSSIISRNIPKGIMIGGNPCKIKKKDLTDNIHNIHPVAYKN